MICLLRRKLNTNYHRTILHSHNIYINIMNSILKSESILFMEFFRFPQCFLLVSPQCSSEWGRYVMPLAGRETGTDLNCSSQ